MEPVRFSIYDDGHAHKVTVTRNNAGEFIASATPIDEESIARLAMTDGDQPQTSSLYASLFHASLLQSVPPETILQVLRVHAYGTDFRRRLRAGDSCELFFDLKDESGTEGPPASFCYTSITAGGETTRYYRFRTPDGAGRLLRCRREQLDASSSCAARCEARTCASPPASACASTRFSTTSACTPASTGPTPPGTPDHGRRQRHDRGDRPQGRVRQLCPHPPCQRLQTAYGHMLALRRGSGRGREGPPGADHRLRRLDGAVVRPARPLRGAGQQPVRRSAVDPGAERAPADAAAISPTSRRSARASTISCAGPPS